MRSLGIVIAVVLALFAGTASAGPIVWGNNATSGNMVLEAFDGSTGTLVDQFVVPNATAVGGNGRGIALLGTTLYYSNTATNGNIYVTDTNTHADLGILFSTGFAVSTIATDGTFMYVTPYTSGSSTIHVYDFGGTLQSTINIAVGNFRDGADIIPGVGFIANRGDAVGPYDLYDLSGTLITAGFIDPAADVAGAQPTGIARDATTGHYFVSDIFRNQLFEYDGAGTFLGIVTLPALQPPTNAGTRLIEDLAIDTTLVPEPSASLLLLVAGAAVWMRRRRRT